MLYQEMAVYPRHGYILDRIATMLSVKFFNQLLSQELQVFRENNALAYRGTYGCFQKSPPFELFNVNEEPLSTSVLEHCSYIQPDYMLFLRNKVQVSDETYKIAGSPDLIVEVWSKANEPKDRNVLSGLYATSAITEFWQIEQDSNTVHCSIGETALPVQTLQKPLQTAYGIEIDLTSLAL
ncbi:MAG: Uma2 family endonuclease [Firmicutes bacterium]|nr:Uma2 family endonuclease [Bacillota bacterium]